MAISVKREAATATTPYGCMDRCWLVSSLDATTLDYRAVSSTDATAVGAATTVTARGGVSA